MVRGHIIGNRWRQELRLINLPRSKMSAHVAKGIRFARRNQSRGFHRCAGDCQDRRRPYGRRQCLDRRPSGRGGPRRATASRDRRECGRTDARHREAASEHVLDGAWRHADPYDLRHRHRALGHFRANRGQPIGRLLGGTYRGRVKAYASILMEAPERMRERAAFYRAQGFRAIKIGWGPFGRVSARWTRISSAPPATAQARTVC